MYGPTSKSAQKALDIIGPIKYNLQKREGIMTGQIVSNDSISCNLSCMCAPKYIKIYKGYDTYYNGKHLIHIGLEGQYEGAAQKYKFILGGITKTYENVTDGFFVDMTAAETGTLPLGPLNGTIIAVDTDGHETPLTTAVPFIIENWVCGDIVIDEFNIYIDVKEGETAEYKINIQSPYFGRVLHNDLLERDADNCHPISSITGLQNALDAKQDVIQDLDDIRNGAFLGSTAVQTIETGSSNGTISVDGTDVAIKGLGSAAFTPATNYDTAGSASAAETNAKNYADSLASNYATAAQGAKADSAVQSVTTGTTNGTVAVDGTDVAVKGLGSAAFTDTTAYDASGAASTAETNAKNYADGLASNYATAAQGLLADSALQPSDVVNNVVSTDTDKPLSANMGKSLQDQVDNLKARGRFLALWNCATGLAQTNPPTGTYEYKAGDYFIVGTVAQGNDPNYRPTGSSYTTGVASTVVETADVDTDDVYYYDGTNWALQINTQKTIGFENIAGSPYDNSNLSSALNDKQDVLTEGDGIDIDSTTNTISNTGVRSVSTGSTNGTVSVNTGGTSAEVAVAGLDSAAYTPSTNYATAAQGAKADTALQSTDLKTINGNSLVGSGDIVIDTDVVLTDIATAGSNITFTPSEYTENYTKTGTLTITSDEKASGFGTSNYITAKDFTFNPGTTGWMLTTKITTPAAFSNDMCVLSSGTGLALRILSDGKAQLELNGTTTIGTITSAAALSASTEYTLVVSFSGTEYTFIYRTGSTIVTDSITSSTGITSGVPKIGVENDNTDPFSGTVDLNQTYISINGSEVWRAAEVTGKVEIAATVPTQPSDIGAATAAQGAKADTALQNTATGTNSLSIEGTSSSFQCATNVGKNSQATNNWTTAVGQLAKATGESAIAIGNSTTASGKKSIAIGNSASVSGIGTIQLGRGTTTDNGCFYVGLTENGTTNNNYKVLDATGKIPNDRLTISTSMSSSSTDSQIPSLKLLYDTCGDIETLINAL